MKKLVLLLAVTFSVSLFSCGGAEKQAEACDSACCDTVAVAEVDTTVCCDSAVVVDSAAVVADSAVVAE